MSDTPSPALPYLNDRVLLGVGLMLGFCLTAPPKAFSKLRPVKLWRVKA